MTSLPSNSEHGGSTDTSLLRRVKDKDRAAWDRLVDWAGPLVFYWCQRAGLQTADREDVFQEVFLAVARSMERFQLDQPDRSFRGWLLRITQNKIIDLARRRKKQPSAHGGSDVHQKLLQLSDQELSSSLSVPLDDHQQMMTRALRLIRGDFEDHTWQAFWRTAVDGLPAADVAQELGMSAVAVRKARSRVLGRLRQEFGELLT
jgi:RNA polymerase sigma-70 factor (ECF subfamily)